MSGSLVFLCLVLVASACSQALGPKDGSPGPRTIKGFPYAYLTSVIHGISNGDVVVLDTRRILIRNFTLNDFKVDTYFWVGRGEPSKAGKPIPDENGSYNKLGVYRGKDIILTLPAGLTFNDIDYLSIWCRTVSTNFGHIRIPKNLRVPAYKEAL